MFLLLLAFGQAVVVPENAVLSCGLCLSQNDCGELALRYQALRRAHLRAVEVLGCFLSLEWSSLGEFPQVTGALPFQCSSTGAGQWGKRLHLLLC